MLDLGGGSLQLVAVRDRELQDSGSWPLGAVRVTERLLPGRRAVSRKELEQARAALRVDLAAVSGLDTYGTRLVGLGGAVRNLAAAAGAAKLGPAGIQGYVVRNTDIRTLVAALAKRPASRRALPGIKPARADVPGQGEREILWAAAMLHDVGVAIDYDGRDEHASYVIRHAGLDGFSPSELALIAEIVRCQRKGRPDVPGADREQAQHCVLALRAALQSVG